MIEKSVIYPAGISLLDVVPAAFPDHVLLKHLKRERDAFLKAFLTRFWRDNGPWALWRALEIYNKKCGLCSCGECYKKEHTPIFVRTWDRFKYFMANSGLTFVVLTEESEDDFDRCAVQGKSNMTFEYNTTFQQAYPAPPDFQRLTACKFMAPVSHADVHIVVHSWGNHMGLTYGRKLWAIGDPSSKEICKLDLLFARLRTCESGLQPL